MKPRHPQYKIKQGDTLHSITKLFGVEGDVWTRYHNNMCRLDNVIRDVLPRHLTEIYLLPELWEKETDLNHVPESTGFEDFLDKSIDSKNEVKFGYNNTLLFKFCPDVLHYEVIIDFCKSHKINTIKAGYIVRWIKRDGKNHLIEISRADPILVNGEKPDLMAEELALIVSKVLYPIELVVSRENGISGVNNFQTIQDRWKQVQQYLRDYYSGDTLEKYIHLNEKVLTDEKILLKSLANDWFLHAYFNNIYISYGSDLSVEHKIHVPYIFGTDGIEYTVSQLIYKDIKQNNTIKINMSGRFSDERSLTDLKSHLSFPRDKDDMPVTGDYDADYVLDPVYNTIINSTVRSSLKLQEQKKVFIKITRIKR